MHKNTDEGVLPFYRIRIILIASRIWGVFFSLEYTLEWKGEHLPKMTRVTQCLSHTTSISSEEQRAIITKDDSCSSTQPDDSCSSIQPDDSIEFLSSQVISQTKHLIVIWINNFSCYKIYSYRNLCRLFLLHRLELKYTFLLF